MLSRQRAGVSNVVFATTVIVIIVVAAGGIGIYASRPPMVETMTDTMTDTMGASAVAFTPAHGAMVGSAWLTVAPLGNGSYTLTVYAKGLEPPSMGDYIVEAAQNSGQMATVPIGGTNATLSEFGTDSTGTGQFFIILNQNPASVYENVSIVFLPDMQMQGAVVVATANV